MENPEAMLDVLSMETFRQRFAGQDNGDQGPHVKGLRFSADDDQLDDIVRDLCIDDSISGCFADAEPEVKETFDLKVWLPNPKKDESQCARTNIDVADFASHLTPSAKSDNLAALLHDVTDTRRKGQFSRNTDGRLHLGQQADVRNKIPFKPAYADTENGLGEPASVTSFNDPTISFSQSSANINGGPSGLGCPRKLPEDVFYSDTGHTTELCDQLILSQQRTGAVAYQSGALEKKRVGTFQGECADVINTRRGPNASMVSTTFSQSLNVESEPKRSVFQRMALKSRMGKKRMQDQDRARIPTDECHAHSKMFPVLPNDLSSGSYQPEVTCAKDQNVQGKVGKISSRTSELTSGPQVSCINGKEELCSHGSDCGEKIEVINYENINFENINYENINSLALGLGNPEPYFLPSFPTTSEDSPTNGISGFNLPLNGNEVQGNRQAFGKGAVWHPPPAGILKSFPDKSLEGQKVKHRKPWYEIDDHRALGERSSHQIQQVNLRAVIEESARVISPEPDTSSDDLNDERPALMNESKSNLPIPDKTDFKNILFERKNGKNSPEGKLSYRFKHRPPPGKLTFEREKSHSGVSEESINSYGSEDIRADSHIHSTYTATDLNTSVSSRLNVSSTSVSISTKTLPSVIPIITSAPSNVSAISTPLSSKSTALPHIIIDCSTLSSSIINRTATSVSSIVQVITSSVPLETNVTNSITGATSTSVPLRAYVTNSITRATSTSVQFHTNTDTSYLHDLNTLATTTPFLSNVDTYTTSALSTPHDTLTSNCLDLKAIPKTLPDGDNENNNNGKISVQLNYPSKAAPIQTIDSTSDINELNERLKVYISTDDQDSLRNVVLNDSLIRDTNWKYDQNEELTPFHLAIQLGRLECLRILLESQPLLDGYGWGEGLGLDLAKMAVMSNQVQCLLLLHRMLDNSWAKSSLDADGDTLMHLAASLNHTDVIVALLSLGHDVNAENKAGISPLKLCLQHSALPKNVDRDEKTTKDGGQSHDLVQKSEPEVKANDSDSAARVHGGESDSLQGKSSLECQPNTKARSLDLRTLESGDHNISRDAHGIPTDVTRSNTMSSANEVTDEKENDTKGAIVTGRCLSESSEAETLAKANGQNTIVSLILTELMRRMSELHEDSQRSSPDNVLQELLGASIQEENIQHLLLKYLKSLQENQHGESQSYTDKDNLSRGQTSTQSVSTKEKFVDENVFHEVSSGVGSNCIQNSPLPVNEAQNLIARKSGARADGDKHSDEKNTNNNQGKCGDRKSDISSADSKSKEIDSFCISSDELYNSPPDRIPTIPMKPRSSRQPQNARVRPLDALNGANGDSSRETKGHGKHHERDKVHGLDARQEFKNHKSKLEISYILESSSTSQDPNEDKQTDYLNDVGLETARRREARRRRWGGLSLLPHHLKKKIERLSQKGKRKTASGGISGSSNSSSSIVTSSSSSGGRGDQSAEGSSSVRAIVDFRDNGLERQFFSPLRAPRNHNTPMHVKPTRNSHVPSASLSLHTPLDEPAGWAGSKRDAQVTSYRQDGEHLNDIQDSDQFWKSTDTFSSMTTVSEDNGGDVIRSISDVSLDDGRGSVSGFYDVRQSRSHRHHHHHHHNHHHHHRSRSSDQSERDRYYHNHRCHHRRRRREALGCSPSRRRHRRPDNGSDDNADIDEADNDTDEDEETDVSDDPRVKVNVDNEEWPDDMLRVQRLAKHLESVQRLQNGNSQVIEMVITGTGEVLTSSESASRDPNHVNIGEAYPFSCQDSKGRRMPLRAKRTPSPSGLVGRRAKIHLFNHEKLNANGNARVCPNEAAGFANTEASVAERCREMDKDVPWNLLTFSDSEDTDFGEMNSR